MLTCEKKTGEYIYNTGNPGIDSILNGGCLVGFFESVASARQVAMSHAENSYLIVARAVADGLLPVALLRVGVGGGLLIEGFRFVEMVG